MIYIDRLIVDNVIKKRILENIIIIFIIIGDWVFFSIYFFWSNGDVLVGMIKNDEVRVIRYISDGIEIEGNYIMLEKGFYLYYIIESGMNKVYIFDYCLNIMLVMNNLGE